MNIYCLIIFVKHFYDNNNNILFIKIIIRDYFFKYTICSTLEAILIFNTKTI